MQTYFGRYRLAIARGLGPYRILFASSTKNMPAVLASTLRPFRITSWLFVVLFLFGPDVADLLRIIGSPDRDMRILWLLIGIALFGFLLLWEVNVIRSLRVHVHRASFKICLNCGYNISGLCDTCRCPECGVVYDYETLHSEWMKWFG